MKTLLSTAALAAVLGLGVLAVAAPASARIVCNATGDCWHTDSRVNFGRHVKVEYHPDDWYFHRNWEQDTNHHWRQFHEGRGYYENGTWVPH
jgi:hypothetical protein